MIKQLKYFLLALLSILSVAGMRAQNPDMLAAYNFEAKKEIDSAKKHIDKALTVPALNRDPEFWYLRGFIYKDYYKSREAANRNSPARMESMKCFLRSMQLDTAKKSLKDNKENLKFIASRFYNDAAQALDTNNYQMPIQNFQKFKEIMIQIEPNYPIKSKEIEFTLALATVYNRLYQADWKVRAKYLELAKAAYTLVLNLDPNSLSANYNMGILYYNQAVYLIKGSEYDIDIKAMDAIQDNKFLLFHQSLPLMEKAYELDPKREETLMALSGIYMGLNDFEKSQKFQEELDLMKKNQLNQQKKDK
jgi:tetratricopeptide (TPR) repeat protein